ncbi:MAG TPA: ankyrin repeat domain-containing protein [Steroidobacteraceae bacterium]|jgi:hypothetical protein|nr:ankyrin repeat domain-containing protein [Steroidobacteraceae bacterium]
MMSKDSAQDQELLDRYRQASDKDATAPSDAVRSAIFAESRRVAEELAPERSAPPFDVSRPAANDSRWKITAFGTAGAALLAALLIAPRYWESLPTTRNNAAPASARTAAPAAASEDKSANADAAAVAAAMPRPKLESIVPTQRSESPQEMAVPPDSARHADSRSFKRAQNYAPAPLALKPSAAPPVVTDAFIPAPTPALEPAPAPTIEPAPASAREPASALASAPNAPAPNSVRASGAALAMSADRAARVSRERSENEAARLESAAAAGNLAQTTLLLDQGAAVNTRDALGRTPLLVAVTHNKLEAVRLLLARGADPNAADNAGSTPLQLARNKDFRDIAALLVRAGAQQN